MGRRARRRATSLAVAATPPPAAPARPLATVGSPASPSAFEGRPWIAVTATADALAVALVAAIAADLAGTPWTAADCAVLGVFALGTVGLLGVRRLYGARPGRMDLLDLVRAQWAAILTAAVVALAVSAVTGASEELSPALLVAAAGAVVVVPLVRIPLELYRRHVRASGGSGTRTLILGSGEVASMVERRLVERPEYGLRPVGFLDDAPAPGSQERVLGGMEDLADIVRRTRAKHVIVAFSSHRDADLLPLMDECCRLGVTVALVPRMYETINEHQRTEHLGALPVVALRPTDPSSVAFAVKHAMSRTIAAVLLLAMLPVFLAIATAIRVSSPGPVFYRQRRIGQDGRVFDMLKFRSMSGAAPAADPAHPAQLHAVGPDGDPLGPGGVEGADRRTGIGRVLRRSSFDELPQLINVLAGHMDLVGPRPERPEFVLLFSDSVRRYDDRHRVKAGMTGWAQINGLRGNTSLAERVAWDNWYIQNWSLWLDLKILIRTPVAILRTKAE